MKKLFLILCCTPLLLATTCENDDFIYCTLEAKAGLNVTVINSQTNIPIVEDVSITAQDGSYQETLEYFPGGEFVFFGAYERIGTYIITVIKPGFQTFTSQTITVTKDECHVIPEQLTVNLVPN
ncbi:MAG: hypothetical protein ACI9XR_000934 [Flavobacterium sp.]|jgi:hypothetical protein